jgi:hypothetical protein
LQPRQSLRRTWRLSRFLRSSAVYAEPRSYIVLAVPAGEHPLDDSGVIAIKRDAARLGAMTYHTTSTFGSNWRIFEIRTRRPALEL